MYAFVKLFDALFVSGSAYGECRSRATYVRTASQQKYHIQVRWPRAERTTPVTGIRY